MISVAPHNFSKVNLTHYVNKQALYTLHRHKYVRRHMHTHSFTRLTAAGWMQTDAEDSSVKKDHIRGGHVVAATPVAPLSPEGRSFWRNHH